MRIGASLFVIALGAILTFAVSWSPRGLDLNVVGLVLMLVGLVGMALRLTVFRRRDVVVRERPPNEREIIREPEGY